MKREPIGRYRHERRYRAGNLRPSGRRGRQGTSVYPREIVKAALRHNAAAVILSHNHPSGVAEPSRADERLTERLREALGLIDVRVLDHIIVGDGEPLSFAERGML